MVHQIVTLQGVGKITNKVMPFHGAEDTHILPDIVEPGRVPQNQCTGYRKSGSPAYETLATIEPSCDSRRGKRKRNCGENKTVS